MPLIDFPLRKCLCIIIIPIIFSAKSVALAQEQEFPDSSENHQTFSDVPPDHPSHTAVEFLAASGILGGYDDGTFRPENPVNRAEALKMIVAPRVDNETLSTAATVQSSFTDVDASTWYHPFAVIAVQNGIIDGPPAKEHFLGGDRVILAEFLKMLELAFGVNPFTDFGDIQSPLAGDAADPDAWYYPYLRFALATSMVTALSDGTLKPGQELTRADAAELVFSLIAYREGIRTPVLMQIAQSEVQNVLSHLSRDDVDAARFASSRAVIAARGAIAVSDDVKAKGIVKISEAFTAIVDCVTAGKDGRYSEAEAAAKRAWELGAKARAFSEELDLSASLVQKIATNLAQEARGMMEEGM